MFGYFVAQRLGFSCKSVFEGGDILLLVDLGECRVDIFLLNAFATEHKCNFDASPAIEAQFVTAVGSGIALVVEVMLLLEANDNIVRIIPSNAPVMQFFAQVTLGLLAPCTECGKSQESVIRRYGLAWHFVIYLFLLSQSNHGECTR